MIPMNLASVGRMVDAAKNAERPYDAVLTVLYQEYHNLWKFWHAAEDEVTRLRGQLCAPAHDPASIHCPDGTVCAVLGSDGRYYKEVRWRHEVEADIEEATLDGKHWIQISRNEYPGE